MLPPTLVLKILDHIPYHDFQSIIRAFANTEYNVFSRVAKQQYDHIVSVVSERFNNTIDEKILDIFDKFYIEEMEHNEKYLNKSAIINDIKESFKFDPEYFLDTNLNIKFSEYDTTSSSLEWPDIYYIENRYTTLSTIMKIFPCDEYSYNYHLLRNIASLDKYCENLFGEYNPLIRYKKTV